MFLSYLDVPILFRCTYPIWMYLPRLGNGQHEDWGCKKKVVGARHILPWPGLGSAVAVASHQNGDFTALLGSLLMHSVAESSLGLGDATEKLIMHLRVLVKEAAPGSEWMSLLTGPGKLES